MSLKASELILNSDGSVYHLGLLPQDIANTVITVGDPGRVSSVSKFFDTIEVKKSKREFTTHTGVYKGKPITVMSTGMGTDNIDIALTELDALVNIDLKEKKIRQNHTRLDIIRIGTTGSIRKDIAINSFLVSELAIGFDGLMHYYKSDEFLKKDIAEAFVEQTNWSSLKARPYVVEGSRLLIDKLSSARTKKGFTATNVGFYGPQARVLRLDVPDPKINDKIRDFDHKGLQITNLEMETSGIYGMAKLLGHEAISMNLVLANRETGEFSENASEMMDELIQYCLDKIVSKA
ncbi:nucleoside phosphorylase [Gramella sp. GC03-9]|uniref:Uridine phosphorylase n=1 Tax=Christiangramia oceanisediminis TaxID=2920386 RepID=A0A9X2KY25_9FLAO|nr:nucleoside phosphorylase [Gramella oceanisediminis]MCP9200428.1 nucleoside phosphorylase [Gramella oceanisediminis]